MSLTIGSLFSGIGGLELGLERAGLGPVIWQAESDPYARKVLAKHWPGVKCYEDVREVDERAERPGLVCGGFPCQDISNAGSRAGLTGLRSGLWVEFARVIRALRPRCVVVENVAALAYRGLGVVLGDLAACGYDAEWDCIPAAAVGAQHLRDRLFVVAYPDDKRQLQPQGSEQDKWGRPNNGAAEDASSDADGARLPGRLQAGTHRENARVFGPWNRPALNDASRVPQDYWNHQPFLGGGIHGVPHRVDRIERLGNAVVPQVAQFIGERIKASLEAPE